MVWPGRETRRPIAVVSERRQDIVYSLPSSQPSSLGLPHSGLFVPWQRTCRAFPASLSASHVRTALLKSSMRHKFIRRLSRDKTTSVRKTSHATWYPDALTGTRTDNRGLSCCISSSAPLHLCSSATSAPLQPLLSIGQLKGPAFESREESRVCGTRSGGG